MPKFPVNFRRKSVAEDLNNETIGEPSFRVLERPDATTNGKSFDGGAHMSRASTQPVAPRTAVSGIVQEENMFAGLKNNRGGSNTTKTASDNSSRHSNASTAPSSTDHHQSPQEHIKPGVRKSVTLEDPQSKSSGSFLRQAGRTFSFGSKKHSLPPIPAEPPVPALPESPAHAGRSRAPTTSTVTATTPPQVQTDFMLDLGGDLSSMLSNFDNRSSTTLKERNLTDKWAGQPSALHSDHPAPVSPPAHPWNSDNSNERLLGSDTADSPLKTYPSAPPPVPRHNFSPVRDRVPEADEDAALLKDSLAASRFLGGSSNAIGISSSGGSSGSFRYGGNDEYGGSSRYGLRESYSSKPSRFDPQADEDNMFSHSLGRPARVAPRLGSRSKTEPNGAKVMTPEQFEKYRNDKARDNAANPDPDESDKEDEDNYDDDEDELEKSKQLARQRRQQESHMTSYRQQMMKVTGESSSHLGHRPQISASMSTPNLALNLETEKSGIQPQSDGSDDEEIPLAILQAHGFPSKNRPPTRMNDSPSPSNLRASMAPPTGPGPSDMANHAGGNLPPFARKLPQDPYLGAGLINQQPRESLALGVGSPTPHQRAAPTGGLVGVIANEERSRAMRRGSPGIDPNRNPSFNLPPNVGHNPAHNMTPQMMYPMGPQQMMPPPPMLTPGDQAQIHMTQQMNQFMQMQMQFMQMMAGGQGQMPGQEQPRFQGHMPAQSAGSLGDVSRNSFLPHPGMGGRSSSMGMGLDMPQPDMHTRTMSMVQPSSASWIQPPHPGFAPSIRIQGDGYTPSIAPSERSNVGLPGRYRPVSSVPPPDQNGRTSTMSGAMPSANSRPTSSSRRSPLANQDDDDEEAGWEEMKAKREKKKSMWRSKKMLGSEISALIT